MCRGRPPASQGERLGETNTVSTLTMDSGLHICEKIHAGWSGAPVLSVVLSRGSRG